MLFALLSRPIATAAGTICLSAAFWGFGPSAQAQAENFGTANPEIKVGIVQRFGQDPDAQLVLEPLSGDRLTLQFNTGGQPQTVTTDRVQIAVESVPLTAPELQEWVVLSTHRSFESAEDSANRWQLQGIETEIAQPDAWQVWAKREVYSTPLLRRLLLDSLQAAGYSTTYIDSRVVTALPKASFTANGYRYSRDQLRITSANRRIQVNQDGSRSLFAGDLTLQPNAYSTYTLVNQVPVELYLRGVVPHEIGASAPTAAVQAQAVLARTYALRNLRRFEIDDYQICADTQCQVYFGLGGAHPATDRAIAATQGLVLTYGDELVDALYSSTTGGVTASFSDVWNGPDRPYLQPVIDSVQTNWDLAQKPLSEEANFRAFIGLSEGFNEDDWPAFRWDRQASLEDITRVMKTYLGNRQHPLANLTQVTGLAVTERSRSGRVQKLQVNTDVGSFELLKDEAVKALVPPRSLLFYLEPVYETAASPAEPSASAQPAPQLQGYRFIGGGFGHGVGMSQTGSYRLAEYGWSGSQILQFYYPGTELRPISDEITFWQPSGPRAEQP